VKHVKILGQGVCLVLLGAGLAAVPGLQATTAQAAPQEGRSLVQQMRAEADRTVRLSREPATGRVGFARAAQRGDLFPASSAGAAVKARQYLDQYAPAFGARSDDLVQDSVENDRYGTTVTYRQVHRGVPVFGSMLKAHLDDNGDLTSVNGYAAPDIDIAVEPSLSAAEAGRRAVAAVKADPPGHQGEKVSTAGVRAAANDLMVYRTGATRGDIGDNVLVHVVEVSNGANIRDVVFVDAHTGKLVNRYSLVHNALERRVYEQSYSPDSMVWKEGDAFPGGLNEDQQNIVEASGESYWFFANAFGRDSYDGAGAAMETVNNDPRISCPNANWNGTTTNYCNGVTSDDVVAHEWGHAYTDYTHDLIYQWQPGALNESYSDIWGETVDLINNRMDADEGDITAKRPDDQCTVNTRGAVSMTINSPATVAGPCTAAAASFGPVFTATGVTTDVVVGLDGTADGTTDTDGCTAFTNAADLAGQFVYVDRGTCAFAVKAQNASDAGAEGIVVGDNVAGRDPISMSGSADIYGVMVTLEDGNRIKSAGTVNATIKDAATEPKAQSFRWLIGEDSSAFGGAIRDMWRPTCYGDPGKVSDAQYFCSTDDGGGVHSNSGVPNHAFALTVDGGDYNGQSITGIGITKAAAIYYRAMTVYQTPTTGFADHADALATSCTDLVGQEINELSTTANDERTSAEVIGAEDCATLDAVAAATELREEPTQCNFQPLLDPDAPSLCGEGTSSEVVWEEDFEDGLAGWGAEQEVVYEGATGSPWVADSDLPGGREGTAAYGPAPVQGVCDGSAEDFSSRDSIISPAITLPKGKGRFLKRTLAFSHYVATEAGYDGGNLKFRSGPRAAWQVVPASAYVFNAPSTITSEAEGNTNPLAGEPGFTGTDGGEVKGSWGESHVDLDGLGLKPRDTLQLRFDIGRDGCGGLDGWYVDDVQIVLCERKKGPKGVRRS
jgi:Zn-dependent metalloprotease